MERRLLIVKRSHHGCTLVDGDTPLAWYPGLSPALEMARLLAEANALRDGPPVHIELREQHRPPRRICASP